MHHHREDIACPACGTDSTVGCIASSGTTGLRWISWNQAADPKHGLDSRPVKWPPPEAVLGFWESGQAGDGSCCTVVALVRAKSASAAASIIEKAWNPGVGEWRFNRDYVEPGAPGDRFPPPDWSIKLGRWPWKAGR